MSDTSPTTSSRLWLDILQIINIICEEFKNIAWDNETECRIMLKLVVNLYREELGFILLEYCVNNDLYIISSEDILKYVWSEDDNLKLKEYEYKIHFVPDDMWESSNIILLDLLSSSCLQSIFVYRFHSTNQYSRSFMLRLLSDTHSVYDTTFFQKLEKKSLEVSVFPESPMVVTF